MPAEGFKKVDAADIGPEHYGRIWRVDFQDRADISNGNKGVRSLVLTEDGIHIKHSDGTGEQYGLENVESILISEETPEQRTLTGWS